MLSPSFTSVGPWVRYGLEFEDGGPPPVNHPSNNFRFGELWSHDGRMLLLTFCVDVGIQELK